MSQSAKGNPTQVLSSARRGRARGIAEDALGEASLGLARAGFRDPTCVLRWAEIVGEEIARVAEPVKWQDNAEGAILTLRCRAGAAVLLQHETRTLIERLNAYLGGAPIVRLKLIAGTLAPRDDLPDHPLRAGSATAPDGPPPDLAGALERLAKRRKALSLPKAPD